MSYTPIVIDEIKLKTITQDCIQLQPLAPLSVSEVLVVPFTKSKHFQLQEEKMPKYLLVIHNVVFGKGVFGKVHKVVAAVKFNPNSPIPVKIRYPQLVVKVIVKEASDACWNQDEFLIGQKFLTMPYTPAVYGNAYYLPIGCIQGIMLRDICSKTSCDPSVLPPKAKLAIVLNAIKALKKIHAEGYLHNDLKEDNVMVGPDLSVSIIDFGSATPIGRRKRYVSDEKFFHIDPYNRIHTTKTDIYGLCYTVVRLFLLVFYSEFTYDFNLFLTLQGFDDQEAYTLNRLFKRAFSMNWVLRPDLNTMEQTFQQLLDARTEDLTYPDFWSGLGENAPLPDYTQIDNLVKMMETKGIQTGLLEEFSSIYKQVFSNLVNEIVARLLGLYSNFIQEHIHWCAEAFSANLTLFLKDKRYQEMFKTMRICYLTEQTVRCEPYFEEFSLFVKNEFMKIFSGEEVTELCRRKLIIINQLFLLKNRYFTEPQFNYYLETVRRIINDGTFAGIAYYKTRQSELERKIPAKANTVDIQFPQRISEILVSSREALELNPIPFYDEKLVNDVPYEFKLTEFYRLDYCLNAMIQQFALINPVKFEAEYFQILVPMDSDRSYCPSIFNASNKRQRYVAHVFAGTKVPYKIKQLLINPGELRTLYKCNQESVLILLIRYVPVDAEFLDSSPIDYKRSARFIIDGPIRILAFKKLPCLTGATPDMLKQLIEGEMVRCRDEILEICSPFDYNSFYQSIVKVFQGYQIHPKTCDVFEQAFLHWLGINPLPAKTSFGCLENQTDIFYLKYEGLQKSSADVLAELINKKFNLAMALVRFVNSEPLITLEGKLFRELYFRHHFVQAVSDLYVAHPHYFLRNESLGISTSPHGLFATKQQETNILDQRNKLV